MSTGHAILSPSGAKRWMACPGSVKASIGAPDSPSVYADRGTAAHHVLNLVLQDFTLDPRSYIGQSFKLDNMAHTIEFNAEDAAAVLIARNYVARRLKELRDKGHEFKLLLEHKVNPGRSLFPARNEECTGTADIIIIGGGILEVADYKHGAGTLVPPEDPQPRLYGLGAMRECLPPEAQRVVTTIIQPRHPGMGEPVASRTWTPEKMADFRDEVSRAATRALDHPEPEFVPDEDNQCRWCPIKATCAARRDAMFSGLKGVFSPITEDQTMTSEKPTLPPDLMSALSGASEPAPAPPPVTPPAVPPANWEKAPMTPDPASPLNRNEEQVLDDFISLFSRDTNEMTPEEYARVLLLEPVMRGWLDAVHESAHSAMVERGMKVPGFKVVRGRGSYSIEDEDAAKKTLSTLSKTKDAGGGKLKKADYTIEKLISPNQLKKQVKPLVSEAGWAKVEALIVRSNGKPVIAPETDTREEVLTNPSDVFTPENATEGQGEASKPPYDFLS